MSLRVGEKLGPYEILAPIDAGGMGEVYRARDTRLGRDVAIKILPKHLSSKPQLRERFEREARAVSSLNHPHICTLHDLGCQDGIDYVVMEYLEGETLAQRLKKGRLSTEQFLEYAIQITDALDTAHRRGVVHRDVKPGNIMLTKKGAKLLDFGLAKMRGVGAVAERSKLSTETTPLTGEGMILGTVQYMAPEQLEGKEVDARTDLFALGAVIYEMATGRKAFEGASQASLISAIMTSEPPSISTPQSMTPPLLDHVVRTCLAKDPEMRWSTAHDVLVELKWIVAAGADAGTSKPVGVRGGKRVWLLSTLLAAASLALLVVTLLYFHRKPAEVRPVRFSISPPEKVTFGLLNIYGPAVISPDGSRLGFVGLDEARNSQLWVRPLDALVEQRLAGTSNAKYPFWSPDGRYLAFFADGKLKKVSAGGGPPETLCNAPDGLGGSWGKGFDGGTDIIVFAADRIGGLSRISAAGGEPVQATVLDSSLHEVAHRQPEFLPDGRHFLYVGIGNPRDNDAIFIGDIQAKPDPKSVRRLMSGSARASYTPPGYLLFVRDNTLMARAFDARRELSGEPFVLADHLAADPFSNASDFSVSSNGVLVWHSTPVTRHQLAWSDRNGKQIELLNTREEYLGYFPTLSPDGNRIAVSMHNVAQPEIDNIWLLDSVRGSKSRLTFGASRQQYPVWSPDGRRIVFGLMWSPGPGLFWKDASGAGNEELLLKTATLSSPSDWSRDGRFILFRQGDGKGGKLHMWVLPLFGDRKPMLVGYAESNVNNPVFSPDGHWIAYESDESGRTEVYVRSFTEGGSGMTGGRWPISTAGGALPRWRRDGKELFFINDGKLMAVPVKGGSTFTAGIPVVLFELEDAYDYDVRPDGQRFLIMRRIDESAAPLVNVCLNWLAGMKK